MAHVLNDRVKETSTTTGTGTLNLAGAVSNFETFVAGIGNSNTTYYAIVHTTEAEFEVGLGTVTDASPDTLARTTIISSSNSDSAVDFSAGSKEVFCTLPASKVIALDNSGNIDVSGDATASTFQPDGDTAAGDNAAIGYTAAEGLILTGQGSTSDITFKNDADATVFTVPTGTATVLFPDDGKIILGASSDVEIFHDATDSYIKNKTGALKIATETSGIAVSIGHTTSETTVNDNLNVTGKISAPATGWFPNHITTIDIDDVANITVDNVFTDTYDVYDVVWDKVLFANDGNYGYFRFIDQSGSVATAAWYRYYMAFAGTRGSESSLGSDGIQTDSRYSAGSSVWHAWGQQEFLAGNNAGEIVNSSIRIFNVRVANAMTTGFIHNCSFVSSNDYAGSPYLTTMKHALAETQRGFYLFPSSGNFLSGQIHVYGFKLDGS
ncbi:MAG: hypothetical protein CBC04_01355 [Verrucomicrobia bacterium TMED44]|nr:MAG: hypothetical protein CBC04_01355 [Verrucomicrobia bacterium TMED44]|tara:strand:+ start:462 stop:1778 length:1317 start_codon:yes stop_codon:yes gene_type:complete